MQQDFYKRKGVSSSKEEVHEAIEKLPQTLFPNAFCQAVQSLHNKDLLSIIHADGAGTKSTLAYIYYKETNDASKFRGIAHDSLVMNLDDVICVGATNSFILSNTIGRNAHIIDAKILQEVISGYAESVKTLKRHGVNITICGGETADLGDLVKTIIIDSTLYTEILKNKFIDCSNISPNSYIIGLSSSGKASYETSQNSGISSNGFTAARHILLNNEYAKKYSETISSSLDASEVYQGKFLLSDRLSGSNMSIGDALLSPTRTYAPIMKEIFTKHQNNISGVIHCTGGGLTKSLKFGSNIRYIKNNLFETPPIFELIKEEAQLSQKEMWQFFNNGHRLEIYCSPNCADSIISISNKYDVEAKIIGETLPSNLGNSLEIQHNSYNEQW